MCTTLKDSNLTWMLTFVGRIITCIKFGRSLFQKREETRLKVVQRPALVSQKLHVILGHT